MIADSQTNKVFFSERIKNKKYERMMQSIHSALDGQIEVEYLSDTQDIWAVDYMPVQIDINRFVQFKYDPDYLREYPALRTDHKDLPGYKDAEITHSDIILDGGNIVKYQDRVIICDKVFHENSKISPVTLIEQLQLYLKVQKIIFIPWDLDDFTGHADGMVRFVNEETVLINEFSKHCNTHAQIGLRAALHNAGIKYIELPYFIPDDPTGVSARGNYLNYLQLSGLILAPVFKLATDERAISLLQKCFPDSRIIPIYANTLSREGGILNCISWNIKA